MRRGETNTKLVNVLAVAAVLVIATVHGALAWRFTPPPVPAVVTVDPVPVVQVDPESIHVYLEDGTRTADAKLESALGSVPAGVYRVVLNPKPGQKPIERRVVVTEGVTPPVVPPPPIVVPPPIDPPPTVTVKASQATYIYEKDQSGPPSPVLAALNLLNRERKILATLFEADTTDGTSDVPEQYKAPLAAAKEAGLPALVVTAGGIVLRVVKNPTTVEAVMEAVP